VTVSGSSIFVSKKAMTFIALRFKGIVPPGGASPPGSVVSAPMVSSGGGAGPAPVSQGYGPCNYNTNIGFCLDKSTTSCSGQFRSSKQGAVGCKAFAATVQCCVSSSDLIGDAYSGFQSSGAPPNLAIIIGAVIGVALVVGVAVAIAIVVFNRRKVSFKEAQFSDVVVHASEAPGSASPQFL